MRLSLDRLAQPFVHFSERFYPDSFVFAILLTVFTFAMAIAWTPTTASEALAIWGQGLTGLLSFISQVCLNLVTAHALAHTDRIRRFIDVVAGWPRRAGHAYALVAVVAGLASLVAGALGLVVGAITAMAVARQGRAGGLRLHFPLLVASAYAGFVIWHMGYSGTAPLFVATPGHTLEDQIGIVSITETMFAPWNVALAATTLAAMAIVCGLLAPADHEVVELVEADEGVQARGASDPASGSITWGQRLDGARILSLALGALLFVYLGTWFWSRGFQLTFDIVNWSLLGLGLLLARSPRHYAGLIGDASRTLAPIVLQYPFYAAMMALMAGSGLVELFSEGFVAIASPGTLGFWAFISGGVLNFFVPSGGGQWVIQGPIFIEGAQQLGVETPVIVMAVAYGDQWTNMIQPFWTLPLLAIVGLSTRAIMGYCFVIFLTSFVVFAGGLLLLGTG
jgi:short-chain fatty acids transporter